MMLSPQVGVFCIILQSMEASLSVFSTLNKMEESQIPDW